MPANAVERYPKAAEILLVEDSEGDVILARENLRGAGFTNTLTVAGDGEEALARLKGRAPFDSAWRPDLILLDLNLPRMDGRELLRTIRADPQLRSIPVIVLTGSQGDVEMLAVRRLQADGHIVKPIDFTQLTRAVSSIPGFGVSLVVSAPSAMAPTDG